MEMFGECFLTKENWDTHSVVRACLQFSSDPGIIQKFLTCQPPFG